MSEQRIIINPAICNGKPTISGTRITVNTILEFLGAGDSKDDLLKAYPAISVQDIEACIQFAAKMMNRSYSLKEIA